MPCHTRIDGVPRIPGRADPCSRSDDDDDYDDHDADDDDDGDDDDDDDNDGDDDDDDDDDYVAILPSWNLSCRIPRTSILQFS